MRFLDFEEVKAILAVSFWVFLWTPLVILAWTVLLALPRTILINLAKSLLG